MTELEKPYIQALVRHFKPVGDVLELGFSKASALEVQKHKPKSHTVIEQDPQLAKQARAHKALTVIEDNWQKALDKLGTFDTLILNGYPLASTPKQMLPLTELRHAKTLLEEEKKLVKMVEETLPNLATMRYSDADLDAFFTEVDKGMEKELLYFLDSLKQNGQISHSQHQNCLEKQGLLIPQNTLQSFWKYPAQFLKFLTPCIENNLRKGGRFCCYIDKAASKYDDPLFFNAIITNPSLEYEEQPITVNSSEALLMVIKCIVS